MARPRAYPAGIAPGLACRYSCSRSHQLMHASRSSDKSEGTGGSGAESAALAPTASKHQTNALPVTRLILNAPRKNMEFSLAHRHGLVRFVRDIDLARWATSAVPCWSNRCLEFALGIACNPNSHYTNLGIIRTQVNPDNDSRLRQPIVPRKHRVQPDAILDALRDHF
jgi:hypothetical protein